VWRKWLCHVSRILRLLKRLQQRQTPCGRLRRCQLGARGASYPTPVSSLAILRRNRVPGGAEIVVVVDVWIALANGVPGEDLSHEQQGKLVTGKLR
jgi:hypothetical protein